MPKVNSGWFWLWVAAVWVVLAAFGAGYWLGRLAGDRDQDEEDAWRDAMAADAGEDIATVVPITGILPASWISGGNVPAVPVNSPLAALRPDLEHQAPMSAEVAEMREKMARLTRWVDEEFDRVCQGLYADAAPVRLITSHRRARTRARRPR